MVKKTKIINFFGGPGIGKSTQAAGLYSLMKKNNMSVELTYEFPKILAWDENHSAIKDQFYITANQHRNISRLYGKVEYIIVDSPILFGLVYKDKYGVEYPQGLYGDSFDNFLLDLFRKYDNINILLRRREESYDEVGRFQDLKESREIDGMLRSLLEDNDVSYHEFEVNKNSATTIYKTLFEDMEEKKWDGGRIVRINQCKECGNHEGIVLPDHPSLAECRVCQHLCDVKEEEQ
tara:strand:+ start:7440 stop:8144 length:705 start_codon:yes stop_codon:yes gene_type:complete